MIDIDFPDKIRTRVIGGFFSDGVYFQESFRFVFSAPRVTEWGNKISEGWSVNMAINLDESLVSIIFGVRYRANFSIEDRLGQIVDQILYTKNSYFNQNVFPKVLGGVGQKSMINEETGDRLTLDNSNVILEVVFGGSFKISDYKDVISHFHTEIINGVMKRFAIKEIVRIGYVKRYIFNIEDLAKKFVDKTIGRTLEGVNDIKLSFSKKLPLELAFVKKDVNDYDNAIFTVIKRADAKDIFMSLDYQRYFDPFLSSATEIEYEPFIENAEYYNNRKYLAWLNSNYIEG